MQPGSKMLQSGSDVKTSIGLFGQMGGRGGGLCHLMDKHAYTNTATHIHSTLCAGATAAC